jgi:predicted transcriptional regulator
MKRWSIIFKIFGNINRLKIIKLLNSSRGMYVTDIARELGISLKSASKHLILLHNLDVLESKGQMGHVLYFVNQSMPKDLRRVIKLFI